VAILSGTTPSIYDGLTEWRGGVDSSVAPSALLTGQMAWAVNTTFRQTYPQPRPGFTKRTSIAGGLFQGAGTYIASNGSAYLVCSIAGTVSTIKLTDYSVSTLGTNNASQPQSYFCQAENWLIVQNNLDLPLFWNGTTVRRSNGFIGSKNDGNEIPVGGPTSYGKGRVWVARGNQYIGSDLVGSNLSLSDPRDSVLQVTENDYLATGGGFSIPGSNPITGLAFSSNIDTSLGQGDLLVFSPDGVWAFNAPEDATTWASLNYPIQRYALIGSGSYSQNAITTINGDVYFRSDEGVRSYYYARREFNQSWGQVPLSRELNRVMLYDTHSLLKFGSAVSFDNRFLLTCQPYHDNTFGIVHAGLVALDFNWTGGLTQRLPPAWEGLWTGLKILQVITCRQNSEVRCFVFAANNSTGQVEIWELTQDQQFDFDGTTAMPIRWSLETPSFKFPSQTSAPTDLKRLINLDVWLDNTTGSVSTLVQFRPSLLPVWFNWGQHSLCAVSQDCATSTCHSIVPYQTVSFDRKGFGRPPSDVNPANASAAEWAFDFQLKFTNVGFFRLKTIRLSAEPLPETQFGDMSTFSCVNALGLTCETGCISIGYCQPDDFSYRSSSSN